MASAEKPNSEVPSGRPALTYADAARVVEYLARADQAVDSGDSPGIPGYGGCQPIGGGGGGQVYRAFRIGSDRPVALKLLNIPIGDSQHVRAAQRAWRELDMLSELHLPCLPRVLDYGAHHGRMFIATEWIDGLPLDRHCREESLDRKDRARLLAATADAVQSLHDHGVIHRDIKPSNILVDRHGVPMIVDFGLAARAIQNESGRGDVTLTTDGTPLGTPAFMAPEQARGERVGSGVSTRSDVYALGATAYLVLTGHTPHDMNTSVHEAIRRVATDPARDPHALDPAMPRPLVAVLRKACAERAADRYPSARDFADDLRRWINGEPVAANERGWSATLIRFVRRRPVAATVAVCVALAVASIAAAFTAIMWMNSEPAYFFTVFDDHGVPIRSTLRSHSNHVLDTVGEAPGSVRVAEMVKWPEEYRGSFPGSKVAVISVKPKERTPGTQGEVWVCDPNDLSRPIGNLRTERMLRPPQGPRDEPAAEAIRFDAHIVLLTDVYEDVPGQEIIVLHTTEGSPCAIRVYDLMCRPLFEAWHSGNAYALCWWPAERMIVACAERHGPELKPWLSTTEPFYPQVVFGLRVDERGSHGWLNSCRDAGANGPLAWYKAAWPPSSSNYFRLEAHWNSNRTDVLLLRFDCRKQAVNPPGNPDLWLGAFERRMDRTGRFVDDDVLTNDRFLVSFDHDEQAAEKFALEFDLIDFPDGALQRKRLDTSSDSPDPARPVPPTQ